MLKDLLCGLRELVYPPNPSFDILSAPIDTSQNQLIHHDLRIVMNKPPFCVRCSRHMGHVIHKNICQSCERNHPYFNFAWSACLYVETLKHFIHLHKFHQKTQYRKLFIRLMISFINTYRLDIHQFDLIIPMPLSQTRYRERGYNQAELLARPLAHTYNINFSNNIIYRSKNTRPQSLLHQKERWTNVVGAFKIKPSISIKERNILIIDDLMTTGATASQAAWTCKQAGAATVGVLTLAITPETT